MNEELEDRIYDVAQVCGFTTFFREDYVYFEAHSPLGEDISFEVYYEDEGTFEDIFDGVLVTFTDFDVEEHAVMWWNMHGKKGAPTDLQKLLDDAKEIKKMYKMLYVYLDDLHKELEEE